MPIMLLQSVRVGGSVLAAGSTQNLDAALEADLVHRAVARYISNPATALHTVPVTAKTDQLTGEVEISAGVMIVVSDGAPEDSDGRPDGTIYIQRG